MFAYQPITELTSSHMSKSQVLVGFVLEGSNILAYLL
jgi:hypothetical protein